MTISEIYAALAAMAHLDAAAAGQLLDLEVATETSLLVPRREVIDLMAEVKRSGKRVYPGYRHIFGEDAPREDPGLEKHQVLRSALHLE